VRATISAAGCVWLVACGGKTETTKAPSVGVARGDSSLLFASGTRLKAHYLDAGGGARQLLAFHDSVLDIECRFVETAAGSYACLPVRETSVFSDADCSAPVLDVIGPCPNAPAPLAGELISARSTDCSARVAAYSVDGRQAQAQTSVLSLYGVCQLWAAGGEPHTVWTTKPEPLARFVQGTVSTVGAAGGVQATRVTADDGAFTTLELVSAGVPCIPGSVDGVLRCLPALSGQPFVGAYTDANCTDQKVAIVTSNLSERCAARQPQYQVETTSLNCGTTTIYTLGDPLSTVFGKDNRCESLNLNRFGGRSFYRIGAPVSSSVFPEAGVVQISNEAITMRFFADRTGVPLLQAFGPWTLPDGTPCSIFTDPGGQKRCLHDWLMKGFTAYFADASCTQPIYITEHLSCSSQKLSYIVDAQVSPCRADFTHVYAPTPYSGPVYTSSSESCQLIDMSTRNSAFLAAGDPVDSSVFPALVEATEP